jgi:transcriptional regulator with XRE-family HTH domain
MTWGKNVGDGCVEPDNALGENIRSHRLALNMTQEKLAEKCELAKSTISKSERCGIISLANLGRIAKALGVEPSALMKGVSSKALIEAEGNN